MSKLTKHSPTTEYIIQILIILSLSVYIPYIISQNPQSYSFLKGDCLYYQAIVESMLHDRDLYLENNLALNPLTENYHPFNGQLAIDMYGGLIPKHPILMPIFSLPFYAILGSFGLLLFNVIQVIVTVILLFLINQHFFSKLASFIGAQLYAFATLLLDYSYNYSPDVFSNLFILGGIYSILKQKYLFASSLMSLSLFAKPTNIILVFPMMIFMVYQIIKTNKSQKKSLFVLITAIFMAGLTPMLLLNHLFFGKIFTSPYEHVIVQNNQGLIEISKHTAKFNQPLLIGLKNNLFDLRNGIIPTNPILIIAFFGVLKAFNYLVKNKFSILILTLLISQILLVAKYDEWHSSMTNNRFLITSIVISSFFFTYFIEQLLKQVKIK